MTREQAKVYVKLTEKDLLSIRPSLCKHYEYLKAFAEGIEIEEKFEFGWAKALDPEFYDYCQYRIIKKAPEIVQHKLSWTPNPGECYYFINISADESNVMLTKRTTDPWSESVFQQRAKIGNVFMERSQAERAFLTIVELLKSLHSCKTDLYF